LTYGTFMESYHGAEYANRLVYKSLPFMLLQGLMFLSILCASLLRPVRPHMYGFHVIHLGLMVLFLGSFVTYQAGVDGSLTLAPNAPARDVMLNEDQFTMQFPAEGKEVILPLPFHAGETKLGYQYNGVTVLRFLPFAEEETVWNPGSVGMPSSVYRIQNPNFGETITVSLHPDSDFKSTAQLGPLSVHYMPAGLAHCFAAPSTLNLIVWNARSGVCSVPGSEARSRKNIAGQRIVDVMVEGESLRFLPELSPLPVDGDQKIREESPFRIFGRGLFEEKPHLFLFGEEVAWFDREQKLWQKAAFKAKDPVALPWMGFEINLERHEAAMYPALEPRPVKPIQDNGQVVQGDLKAVEVEVDGTRFWISSTQAMSFARDSGKVIFELAKKKLPLPFEITLDRFKMDTDPGTNTPASYESFVSLFKGNLGTEKHHVYMNHPLKHDAFTFYQASYFQTQQGPYGSVFSVNYDPGRPLKYLGSLLLVLGSIWHFVIRGRKKKVSA
jgi:hypothetical protein